MLTGKYSLHSSDKGILNVLFPDRVWYEEPFGPFVREDKLLLFSKRDLDFYPKKDCVLITPSAPVKLDTKPGILEFLEKNLSSFSESLKTKLLLLDDSDFWQEVKLVYLFGSSFVSTGESESVFTIFSNLFEPYPVIYPLYKKSKIPHMVVFSSLLTMMLKTQMENLNVLSAGYRKVLLKNKKYYGFFKKAVLEYLSTDMQEKDFLSFLMNLNLAKR